MTVLHNGFELIEDFISESDSGLIASELSKLDVSKHSGGVRNVEKKSKYIHELVHSEYIISKISTYLKGVPCLVRAIYFNKTVNQNWLVPWHQDKTVCVSKKFESTGWAPWSFKDGVLHVQPPVDVLNQMVSLRLHLDDSNLANGCLKIMPHSHKLGVLNQADIAKYVAKNHSFDCIAKKGTALVMRPIYCTRLVKAQTLANVVFCTWNSVITLYL